MGINSVMGKADQFMGSIGKFYSKHPLLLIIIVISVIVILLHPIILIGIVIGLMLSYLIHDVTKNSGDD